MAAIWRRAWRSRKVSSTGLGSGSGSGGGGSLRPISGTTTTTTATYLGTTTYTTISSGPVGERRPLVVDEDSAGEERLDLDAMEFKEMLVHLRGLVEEFCDGASGHISAPDSWLSELNVAWLLHLVKRGASERGSFISRRLHHLVQSWILALRQINTCICAYLTAAPPAAPEFLRFIQATLCKMLTFVGAVVAVPLNVDDHSCQEQIVCMEAGQLRALLDVRDALSSASEQIIMSLCSSPYVQVQSARIVDDMGGLLSVELDNMDQAVCDATDRIRAAVMSSLDDDDSSCSWATAQTLQPSPDIHKVTRSVVDCIKVMSAKALLAANDAHRGPDGGEIFLTSFITEMVTSLEEKLSRVSQSFPDQSLGFLFLINNTYFIGQQLHHDLTHKINKYIESYLQVSWAPMLKCLNNPTFHCFTRRNSPLRKFESEFQMAYAAQKLRKAPDPWLRKRLREAIIEEVVSDFTIYLEDNSRITPGVTPQQVEEMLQELFEG